MRAFISKQELAEILGISGRSLTRFLLTREEILTKMGYQRMNKLLPRRVAGYVLAELGVPENEMG